MALTLEGNFVKDDNVNESLEAVATASAVNHVQVVNAATGNAPALKAAGDDTNVDLSLQGKGTGGVQIGSGGGSIKKMVPGTQAIDPASIAAASTGDTTFALVGAALGDLILMSPPVSLEAGLVFGGAWVSAADTVTVRLGNVTAGAIDGASRTWSYVWIDRT